MNVFDKTFAKVLELSHKKDTAVMINAVTQLWNCLNIKKKHGWVLLNDKNREPFSSTD